MSNFQFTGYITYNPNAENDLTFLLNSLGENEWTILTLLASGIDPGTSRTPGKCHNHYTMGVGS